MCTEFCLPLLSEIKESIIIEIKSGEENKNMLSEASLLKRQGTSQELAGAVLFLAGSGSSYITGSTIHVNGGSLLI